MKKITLLLLAMFCFTFAWQSSAQSVVIGTGTGTTTSTGSDPIDGYFNSFRYQVVYTAAELSTALTANDEITALGWSIAGDYGGGNLLGYTIKIGHTTATNSAVHDASPTTVVKNPFSYNPTVTADGVFDMITFDTNFVWNGVDNILVEICSDGSNAYTAPYGQVRTTTGVTNGSRRYRTDGATSCGVNTNTANPDKPNVQFNFIDLDPPACPAPNALTASNLTLNSADLGWTENGSSTNWDIEWGTDGFTPTGTPNVNDTGDNPYNLAGLSAGTAYDFYVRSDCGADDTDVSTWSGPFSFTTVFVAPDCATTPFPADGATDVPVGNITFTWTAPATGPTPTSYNVYAYDDALGTNPFLIVNVLTASADLVINAYDTEIFWAAVPVNGDVEATGCAVWSFVTAVCTVCPVNDDCDAATSIVQETGIATAAGATPTPGTIVNATNSGLPAEACAGFTGNANDDVWYSFEALTEDVNITIEATGTAFDIVVQLYNGTCGSLVVESCADATVTTPPVVEQVSATGLTPGDTYYFRVYQYGTSATTGKTFNAKVWSPQTLSVDSSDINGFTYFPNPVKNTLQLNAQSNIQNVSIFNILGQEVHRTAPNTIDSTVDMSALQTGAYFVKVTINDRTETVRVIKQ